MLGFFLRDIYSLVFSVGGAVHPGIKSEQHGEQPSAEWLATPGGQWPSLLCAFLHDLCTLPPPGRNGNCSTVWKIIQPFFFTIYNSSLVLETINIPLRNIVHFTHFIFCLDEISSIFVTWKWASFPPIPYTAVPMGSLLSVSITAECRSLGYYRGWRAETWFLLFLFLSLKAPTLFSTFCGLCFCRSKQEARHSAHSEARRDKDNERMFTTRGSTTYTSVYMEKIICM